jgi:hypothetical protein
MIAADQMGIGRGDRGMPEPKPGERGQIPWAIITSVASLLVSASALYVGLSQYRLAEQALISSNRAWLVAKNVQILSGLETAEGLSYQIWVDNVGKEPATKISHSPNPHRTVANLKALEGRNDTCSPIKPTDAGFVVFPNIASSMNGGTAKPLLDRDDILSGKRHLVLEGCIAYESFRQTRHTAFCFVLLPSDKPPREWNLRFCHNRHYAT